MKKKLTNNLGMKILSLVLATILWLVVVNIDNPVIQRQFRDIPVDIINGTAITSKGKVYEVVEGKTVDITVKGKRNIVDSLNKSDMKAEADLKNLIFTNAVPIIPYCTRTSLVEVEISGDAQTLKVALEDIDTKQYKVTIVSKGEPETGYSVGTIQAKPNILQVTGAKSQIAKIDQVRVEMDVSNGKTRMKAMAVPKAYDAKGRYIESEKLTFSSESVALTADFLKTKTVKLSINPDGNPRAGYEYVSTEYEPKEVLIAGEPDILNNISEIQVKVDITDAIDSVETETNIAEWIPEGVKLVEESQTVMVNILIEKVQIKTITFNTNDIELRNLPTQMQFNYNQTNEMSVSMTGLAHNLKDITTLQIKPYIDLEGLGAGNHAVKVLFDQVEGVNIEQDIMISITLIDNNEVDTDDAKDTDNADTLLPPNIQEPQTDKEADKETESETAPDSEIPEENVDSTIP